MIKKILFLAVCALFTVSCQKSIEERAADEAENFTQRECPRTIAANVIQDSLVFESSSKTLIYYYTLQGNLDNKPELDKHKEEYRRNMHQGVITMPSLKKYVEAGFAFRYVYRSEKNGETLIDMSIRPKKQTRSEDTKDE